MNKVELLGIWVETTPILQKSKHLNRTKYRLNSPPSKFTLSLQSTLWTCETIVKPFSNSSRQIPVTIFITFFRTAVIGSWVCVYSSGCSFCNAIPGHKSISWWRATRPRGFPVNSQFHFLRFLISPALSFMVSRHVFPFSTINLAPSPESGVPLAVRVLGYLFPLIPYPLMLHPTPFSLFLYLNIYHFLSFSRCNNSLNRSGN